MSDFNTLSITPWAVLLDQNTGEIWDIAWFMEKTQVRVWKYIEPIYSQEAIDTVRSVTSPFWEQVLCSITWWKRVKKWNNKWYDVILPNGNIMESKIWRIGNSAVIKREQLEFMNEDWLYGIVYYRTTNNHPPSYFTSQKKSISPQEYLKRNMQIDSVFIFPKSYIVYYYNTSDVREWKISTTWVRHKPITHSRASKLFDSNPWRDLAKIYEGSFGRHSFSVYAIWYWE